MSSSPPTPKRTPCPGSCHCGAIQYIIYLTLPYQFSAKNPPSEDGGDQEVYRCNCTTCYKMGMFHVHPANPRDDFVVLSPLDMDGELSKYQCYDKKRNYYFCPRCGVRCFTLGGQGEVMEVEDEDVEGCLGEDDCGEVVEVRMGGEETQGGKGKRRRKVWRMNWDGGKETEPYVSVNGTTIEWREDFDLRVLTEEKRVMYLDGRSEPEKERERRWDRPHYGGIY